MSHPELVRPRVVTSEPFSEHGAAIVVDGDLDLEFADQLESEIAAMIADRHRHLVIDLSAASFLDSMAMGSLLLAIAPLQDDPDAAVVLAGVHGMVDRSLAVSGIGAMFAAFSTRDAAIAVVDRAADLEQGWRAVRRRASPPSG